MEQNVSFNNTINETQSIINEHIAIKIEYDSKTYQLDQVSDFNQLCEQIEIHLHGVKAQFLKFTYQTPTGLVVTVKDVRTFNTALKQMRKINKDFLLTCTPNTLVSQITSIPSASQQVNQALKANESMEIPSPKESQQLQQETQDVGTSVPTLNGIITSHQSEPDTTATILTAQLTQIDKPTLSMTSQLQEQENIDQRQSSPKQQVNGTCKETACVDGMMTSLSELQMLMLISKSVSKHQTRNTLSIHDIFTSNEQLTPNDDEILLIISHSLRLERRPSLIKDSSLIDRAIFELWQVRCQYLINEESKIKPLELMHFILLLVSDRRTSDVGKLSNHDYLKSLQNLLIPYASIKESALDLICLQCCNSQMEAKRLQDFYNHLAAVCNWVESFVSENNEEMFKIEKPATVVKYQGQIHQNQSCFQNRDETSQNSQSVFATENYYLGQKLLLAWLKCQEVKDSNLKIPN